MKAKNAQRVEDHIEHILDAIERIESYMDGVGRDAFMKTSIVQDAVIRNFEIIGEAANKIQTVDPAFVQRHPQLRLDLAYRMRNALIHGYDSVNLSTIWNTIEADLPSLKQQLASIARAYPCRSIRRHSRRTCRKSHGFSVNPLSTKRFDQRSPVSDSA